MRIKLGIPLSLGEIAVATGGRLLTQKDKLINFISTDTRELMYGDLFIAVQGVKFDGENFVKEAKEKGAFALSSSPENADILHEKSSSALLSLAEYYSKTLPFILYNIGITGSVGKSTTKEFLKIILSQKFNTHASSGNYNNEIGMPMSMLSAPKESQILLMEMGMNHPGEIGRLSKCLHPNFGLITNIGTAHIGNLGSRENIASAKLEICDGMEDGVLFVPYDEPLLQGVKNRITFSHNNPCADFSLTNESGPGLTVLIKGKKCFNVDFAPLGEHHRKCLISALAIAITSGLSEEEIRKGVCLISNDNTRQKLIFRENYTFYTDFYNSSYESVSALIRTASELVKGKNKSIVLGDILELGNMSREIHFNVGKMLNPDDFNFLFLFGKEVELTGLSAIENGFPKERIFYNNDLSSPQKTAEQIRTNCSLGETIFMKASRGIKLERILECFEKRKEKNE